MKRKLTGMCVFCALFGAILLSQNTASIFGTITDPTGAVVANAAVQLIAVSTRATYSVAADQSGKYSFAGLGVGEYELSVTVAGFNKYTRNIRVTSTGQRVMADIVLNVGSSAEAVTVTAQAGSAYRPARISARGIRRPSGPANTEQYDYYIENDFAATKSQPLSTFSVDVDTASYSNVRRLLHEGRLPPPGAVRIEELINYFTYDYPLPEDGKPVSMTTHLIGNPWHRQRQILHVGLRTKPIALEHVPPSNLTFLIDVSGSMMPPERLPLIKRGLQLLVEQLRDEDHVSLVVYAGAAGVVLQPTPGSQKEIILHAIERLSAGGSTHGSAGIRLAYEMARQSFVHGGNNRVILATDGDFNVGVSSDDELVRLIEKERESGVFLSVLGVGTDNLKDSRMEKLADHGNGNYAYLDSLSEARKVLVEQMTGTLVTVAKDVKLQIEFNPSRVKAWRLIGYENRVLRPEEFNDDKRDAGDLGAGHQVTAFYEIIPAESAEDIPGVDRLRYQESPRDARRARSAELAWVKLRHKKPQSNKSDLLEWPVSATEAGFRDAPADVRFATAVAEFGMLLRESKFAANASFEHVLKTANEALGPDLTGRRAEFVDLARRARQLSRESSDNQR